MARARGGCGDLLMLDGQAYRAELSSSQVALEIRPFPRGPQVLGLAATALWEHGFLRGTIGAPSQEVDRFLPGAGLYH